jgi:hypothetical protein
MRRHQTREDVVTEIREILAAIEHDLEPFLRGDNMNYTGYLAENADDLNTLIQGLLGEMRNE